MLGWGRGSLWRGTAIIPLPKLPDRTENCSDPQWYWNGRWAKRAKHDVVAGPVNFTFRGTDIAAVQQVRCAQRGGNAVAH